MLFTKCILNAPLPRYGDGVRISVMSRHTLRDGKTPDLRIQGKFNIHLPIFAPSPRLIGDYYNRGLNWEMFEKLYLEEIRSDKKIFYVRTFAALAMLQDMTIMCIEDYAMFCHRRLLAEECKRHQPLLRIEHR